MTLRLLHSLPTRRSADLSFTQIVKPPVCTLRGSLSGKHSGRVFSLPFKGKNSCSIGKVTREIFLQGELQPLPRSEEHTSELQSRGHLVCRLLLEKKNDIV